MANHYLSHTVAQLDEAIGKVLSGNLDIPLQEKTVTPSDEQQVIVPDSVYKGLSKVTIKAIPDDYTNGVYSNGYNDGYVEGIASIPRVDSITTSGTYDTASYHADYYGAITSDGKLLLVVEGGTSTSYEAVNFTVTSVPSGVTLYNQSSTTDTSGTSGAAYVAVFTGITSSVNIALDFSGRDATNDYVTCAVTITYS